MIELSDALLAGGIALMLHILLLPDLIWYFRELPDAWWMAPWTQRSFLDRREVPRSGWNAWVGIGVGVFAMAGATLFSALLLFAGGFGTVIGAVELVLAIAWFRYLLSGSRISR